MPRTLTFGLPGGPDDPLVGVITRQFSTAAFIHGSDAGSIQVITDIQNVRFDQLLFAEEAQEAYSNTPAGERALWHFPPLEPQGLSIGSPESISFAESGSRHDGHVVDLPVGGNGGSSRATTPVHNVGREGRTRIRPL